ncbi:tetratricopeptide repeat protein [Paenibacillus sp. 2TAB19]|uniref:tetratricopeptide repeat protein n=1 Tax=Paenibacillus sp. 2TAB19 TaxID=3233003 RepID=UPI003F95D4AA
MLYHQPVYKEDGRMDGEGCIKKAYEFILNSDFEQAIYWFEQAIAVEPDNASYYHKCAISCSRSGKWNKAKHYADGALALEPDNAEFRFHLHTIESKLLLTEAKLLLLNDPNQPDKAIELLIEATRLDPLCFEAFYTLGVVYGSLGRLDEAVTSAREALRLEPEHSSARTLFADVIRKRRSERLKNGGTKRKRNR